MLPSISCMLKPEAVTACMPACRLEVEQTRMLNEPLVKLKNRARNMVLEQFNIDNGWTDSDYGTLPLQQSAVSFV